MEDMTESEEAIAWLWVIEAITSYKEVGLSLIRDLVQEAPELPCGLAKNAKERIALRCLEELCARQNRRMTSDVAFAQDSKVEFDLLESCENVLRRIVQETSESHLKAGGSELAKWDIQPFIRHKKANLPKLALEKLRDSVLDGTHPNADFLREKSGLGSTNRNNGVCTNDKNRNSDTSRPNTTHSNVENERVEMSSEPPIFEDKDKQSEGKLQNGYVLPSKRGRSCSTDENRAVELENHDGMDNSDVQNVNIKKAKMYAPADNQPTEQNSAPLCENELHEDSSEKNVSVTARGNELAGSKMGNMEEITVLEDSGNDCTVSKRSRDSNNDKHEDEPEIDPPNADVMPQETTTTEPGVHLSPEGSKDVNANSDEPSGIPSPETVLKISTEEPKSSHEHDLEFKEPNSSANDELQEKTTASEAKENANECCEEEISSDSNGYHKERTDVAMKKHEFLSSQLTDSQYSVLADSSQQNLCMKCSDTHQALACSSNNCQVVVHEKCLGSSAIFDDKGNFYCPFCAYSLAITEYIEAKKRSSSSQKELAAFIRKGSVHHHLKKSTARLNKKRKLRAGSSKDENHKGKNHKDYPLEERAKNEGIPVATDVNEDRDRDRQNLSINNQQAEFSAAYNDIADLGCEEKCEEMVEDFPSARVSEGQQSRVPRKSDNLSANTEMDPVNQGNEDLGIRPQVVKQQDTDPQKQLAQEFSLSSEGDDDESIISNYRIRVRKGQIQHNTYPAIPQSRRKKLPWTAEEEQKLKDGVEMFSGEQKIPWKKVLESGGPAFLGGRTPGDLKDKWRNMCRYSKSKRLS